jgi:hypothetical protein
MKALIVGLLLFTVSAFGQIINPSAGSSATYLLFCGNKGGNNLASAANKFMGCGSSTASSTVEADAYSVMAVSGTMTGMQVNFTKSTDATTNPVTAVTIRKCTSLAGTPSCSSTTLTCNAQNVASPAVPVCSITGQSVSFSAGDSLDVMTNCTPGAGNCTTNSPGVQVAVTYTVP